MSANLKICIVCPLFHPSIGGPGRQAFIMARQLLAKGVNITVISRFLSGVKNEVDNIEVHYMPTFRPYIYNLSEFTIQNFIISISFALGAMIKLFKLRRRYEIVQFYSASLPLLVCLPLLKILGKKVVAKTTGGRGGKEAGGLEDFFLKPLLVAIFKYTDKFIAINEDIRQRLLDEGFSEEKIIKIPNGVNTGIFSLTAAIQRKHLRNKFGFIGKSIFLYSGRLVKGKGLELLIKALAETVDINQGILLVMIGDGELKDFLKKMAGECGVKDFVRFEGTVDNVAGYLNASDIFVIPSFSEGMPNSLLEAMACGLPVIASRIGGVVDVVEDGKSGILIEPGDVSGFADAMVKLLNDAELRQRLGAEARKRILEHFSIDRVADEYIKLYKRVLGIGEL